MWIVRTALGNVYLVIVLALMIVVVGAVALSNIPVDILPVFKAPAVQVLTYYNGMPASSIEKTITNRIERWVKQAPGARLVESKSVPGVSVCKIYFRDDIDPNGALTLTNSLELGTLPSLPCKMATCFSRPAPFFLATIWFCSTPTPWCRRSMNCTICPFAFRRKK